ncbi:hypothetical protein, variant [Phialophora macrospora]|nr:hypothetical protein, variant [Phialophora macrospora]
MHHSSEGQKITWLENMFPGIPRRELASVLASHDGSLDKATDELLNLSFLNQGYEEEPEELPAPKGIDGFAEEVQSYRKGRKKRKARTNESSRGSSTSSSPYHSDRTPINVWATMSEDVDFICSRTKLHPQTVRSEYHLNGARLSSTIRALATKEAAEYKNISDSSPILDLQVAEFQHRFQHVPKSQMYGLLSLARNIPSAAQELLEAMTTFDDTTTPGKLHDVAQYTPVDLKENRPFETASSSKGTSVTAESRASAAAQRIAAGQKFAQASAAYKKSKSNPLFGGVAAYYSEIAREQMKAAKEAHAAEADLLVSKQSSATVLDLHGVSVPDAVRIASAKTQSWWDGLGDAKYAPGGGGPVRVGFRIVTGLGTHSKNRAPRIGPAVSKMLIREGWKVTIGHGELIVTGKTRG